ncbi:MAG: hypothetical protein BBJ57_06065 [Desulfobacterales bacterium PC51MH44]|nr:MAG: hypothetical protein BBJ57_06065 [Desulfobacterales bacterium PC51MH44]
MKHNAEVGLFTKPSTLTMKESCQFKVVAFLLIILFVGIFLMIQSNLSAQERKTLSFHYMATPDNHSIRYGVWYCQKEKRRGSVILLNGRTEFMEKYAETISELNQRGFDVYSFDWRGQGLSTRMLANRHKGFIENYDIYINDLENFISKVVQPEAASPLVILAHSMGAHIALRFIHDHPGVADRAVLVSPMINISPTIFPRWFIRFIVRVATKAGFRHAYAIGSGDYADEKFEGNKLTSDPERFMDEEKAIAKNPDLALGGVTYGWLASTFESIDILTKPGFAEKITAPILIISAGDDKVVSIKAQKGICSSLANCRFTEIPGARHEILMEIDAIRSVFWDEFDRFTGAGLTL